ncbi:MAG: hypothetical protein H8D45_11030 [Bacteroidetes bacterium]|nr:hypothetical protein [Bacteroidota bacterium]
MADILTIRDENDKTLNNIEVVERTTAEVEGKKVELAFDENGKPYVEKLPEGITEDEASDYLEKVGADKKVIELGNTISKYKTARTEQNNVLKDNERLKRENDEWSKKYQSLEQFRKQQTEQQAEQQKNVIDEDQVWKDTVEGLKNIGIDVTDDDEIIDALNTVQGKKIEQKSRLKYDQMVIQSNLKQNIDIVMQSTKSTLRNEKLKELAKSGDLKVTDVLAFQEASRLSHLPPERVIKYYKAEHGKSNLSKQINDLEDKKLRIPIYIGGGDRKTEKKIVGDPFAGMSQSEITTLVRDNPNDPRVLKYREMYPR